MGTPKVKTGMAKTCKSNDVFGHSGGRASNAYFMYLEVGDSCGKLQVIPDDTMKKLFFMVKGLLPRAQGASYQVVGGVNAYQA